MPNKSSYKAKARERELAEAMTKLTVAGIPVQVCSPYHLKFGPLNYYLGKGRIFRDGEMDPHHETGIDSFVELCSRDAGLASLPA